MRWGGPWPLLPPHPSLPVWLIPCRPSSLRPFPPLVRACVCVCCMCVCVCSHAVCERVIAVLSLFFHSWSPAVIAHSHSPVCAGDPGVRRPATAPSTTVSSTGSKAGTSFHASLHNWYLNGAGSIVHSGGITSRVGDVSGRVVTTAAFGSRYQLCEVAPAVRAALDAAGAHYDPENPLADARGCSRCAKTHL